VWFPLLSTPPKAVYKKGRRKMNKKHIISVIIGSFIVTNIVTFVFARSASIFEKQMAESYEEIDADINSVTQTLKKISGPAYADKKSINTKHTSANNSTQTFDDSQYLYTNISNYPVNNEETGITQAAVENTAAEKSDADDADESPEAEGGAGGLFLPQGQQTVAALPRGAAPTNESVHDDDIPIPQLPLFDTDYDIAGDDGGIENVLLPSLPNETEVS